MAPRLNIFEVSSVLLTVLILVRPARLGMGAYEEMEAGSHTGQVQFLPEALIAAGLSENSDSFA